MPNFVAASTRNSHVAHMLPFGGEVPLCGQKNVKPFVGWMAEAEYVDAMPRQGVYTECSKCQKAAAVNVSHLVGYGPQSRAEAVRFAKTCPGADTVMAETATGWHVGFYQPSEARRVALELVETKGVLFAAVFPGSRVEA